MKNKPNTKPYWEMTADELRKATKDFDEEFFIRKTAPLAKGERARIARARRKPGRPRVGQGAQRVLLTIERGLLKDVDSLAKRHGLTRSALIVRSLQAVMGKAG